MKVAKDINNLYQPQEAWGAMEIGSHKQIVMFWSPLLTVGQSEF
jgi:hypothetical protein